MQRKTARCLNEKDLDWLPQHAQLHPNQPFNATVESLNRVPVDDVAEKQ